MDLIEEFEERLKKQFPSATISTDRPIDRTKGGFLDIWLSDRSVVMEWRSGQGIGVSYGNVGKRTTVPFLGPDTVFSELQKEEAYAHIVSMVTTNTFNFDVLL